MQCQTEPVHHQPDPPERFPGLRLRAAHRHEIIGVSNQNSQLATPRHPDPVQLVQVDVGQQRRDYGLNGKGNFEFDRTVGYRKKYGKGQ
jgi:hypothetical protein